MSSPTQSNNRTVEQSNNLYIHFPFCRTKCSYCALYSRTGVSPSDRATYVRRLADELDKLGQTGFDKLRTVYFGGGSPALCDLSPLTPVLRPLCGEETEFTVELHPLDVTEAKLSELKALGVNRISMGVQSLNDAVLADMGRGYTVAEAERAFRLVKRHFDNAGIDLIVGYPGENEVEVEGGGRENVRGDGWKEIFLALKTWGLRHCSVYSLQNERGLKGVPDDDWTLDRLRHIAICLREMGLERYEISNYAVPGCECRHNLAVWRGEDYVGLGDGAYGRVGLERTFSGKVTDTLSAERDLTERTIFRLRMREGLDATSYASHPSYASFLAALERSVARGLLAKEGTTYRLTERGTEVCDAVLAELV